MSVRQVSSSTFGLRPAALRASGVAGLPGRWTGLTACWTGLTGCWVGFVGGWLAIFAILGPALGPSSARAGEPLAMLEEDAIKAAASRVAPCVVRIETVGGLERVGSVLIGSGSTTGLVVSSDGYIISSAFNFAQKPDSILVTLPGGNRTAAKLVATDYDRKLVLLKINSPQPLPTPEPVPSDGVRVGQWAIALGRTFDGDRPSVSVGIVSAVHRIWNKAIQTDAKVSPSNYGGPLVDISGRVLGVLAPLTPDAGSEVAGVDWYDSGIGFAVPLDHVLKVLPRMREGHDLRPGILGISLKSSDIFAPPAIIGACRPNSPAFKAGVRAGDEVVRADDCPVTRIAQLKMALGSHYAGDRVMLAVKRGGERLEFDVELTDKLDPFDRPFLGILPMRFFSRESDADHDDQQAAPDQPDPADSNPADGDTDKPDSEKPKDSPADGKKPDAAHAAKSLPVVVRYVYPAGPADRAGLAAGDTIVSLDGKPIAGVAALSASLCELAPGQSVSLEIANPETPGKGSRGANKSEHKTVKVTLGRLPEDLPGELPAAYAAAPADAGAGATPLARIGQNASRLLNSVLTPDADRPRVGAVPIKLPEFENQCMAYVPQSYNPAAAYGLVVWLHGSERPDDEKLIARWKSLCEERGLILLAPRSADPARWQPTEAKVVRRMIGEVAKKYRLDRSRIVVHGHEGGGSLAYLMALANRDVVRGVAVVDAAFPVTADPPENDPLRPLAIYTTRAAKAPSVGQLDAGVKTLRDLKFPVSVVDVGPHGRYLTPAELDALGRWIDALDRL